jgi:hypothetical protein
MVGPGHHVIAMEFSATRYVVWGVVSILGWFGCLALAVIGWRRARTAQAA